jgi:hypothetical protein
MEVVWFTVVQNSTVARDRFKSYADGGHIGMDYKLEPQVLLLSMYSLPVFGVRISMPRYFGLFLVSTTITPVAYRLALPGNMGGIRDVFHVFFFGTIYP